MSSPFESPAEFPAAPRRRVWPLVFGGCGVVGLIVVLACGGFLFYGFRQVAGHGEISVEVDHLFQKIAGGQAADYYRNRTSPEFKRSTKEQDFADLCRTIHEQLGPLNSKTANSFSVRNFNLTTYVNATYACEFANGKASAKVTFQRDNNQWLLTGFHVNSPALMRGIARDKCPHCGGLYQAGAKFCPHCGKKLGDEPTNSNESDAGNN